MAMVYGPYTPLRRVGNFLFVSGQVGIDPETKTAKAAVAAQTCQVLLNMERALQEVGATLNDIVKTTIYLTDIGLFQEVNAVYEAAFQVPRPARSTVGVSELPRVAGDTELLVEIEAVAYLEVA